VGEGRRLDESCHRCQHRRRQEGRKASEGRGSASGSRRKFFSGAESLHRSQVSPKRAEKHIMAGWQNGRWQGRAPTAVSSIVICRYQEISPLSPKFDSMPCTLQCRSAKFKKMGRQKLAVNNSRMWPRSLSAATIQTRAELHNSLNQLNC
jgi:hypothetical protein